MIILIHDADTPKLTAALMRAMVAVRDGKVTNKFTASGNTFHGPRSIAPQCYRRLQALRFIEDVPGQTADGVYASHFKQRLSTAGVAALTAAGELAP